MIVKIQPANPNTESAIRYNERKMDGAEGIRPGTDPELAGIENGHVLVTRNLPEGKTLSEEFEERKLLSMKRAGAGRRMKNAAFHMSVNPGEEDRVLDEQTAVRMIDEMMAGIGYARQPYRIYKHTDIARTHYHVVSCRIDEKGSKVNDSFERLVLREKLKEMSKKYGFSIILSEKEKKEEEKKQGRKASAAAEEPVRPGTAKTVPADRAEPPAETAGRKAAPLRDAPARRPVVPAYSGRDQRPLTVQMREITEDVLANWHFSTFEQVQALLLRRYNILLEIERGREDEDRALYSGTKPDGTPCTTPVPDDVLGTDFFHRMMEKASKERMRNRREQRERLEKLGRAAAAKASSYDEFVRLMERKGVITVLSWSKTEEAFGVTWLDKATKCAWKGSETQLTVNWLKEHAEANGWTLEKDRYQETVERRAKMPSRRERPKTTPVQDPGHGDTSRTRLVRGSRKGAASKAEPTNYLPGHHKGSSEELARHEEDWLKKDKDDRPAELVQ